MRINQLKYGILLNYLTIVLSLIVGLFYTPLMIKYLGQSEYGLYNLSASTVAYLGVLNFGFGSAYIKYYMKYKVNGDNNNINRLNGLFVVIFVFIAIIAGIFGIILSRYANVIFGVKLNSAEIETAKILLIILSISISSSLFSVPFYSYMRANERFVILQIVSIARIFIGPFVTLPILIMGFGSIGFAMATSLLNILIDAIVILYAIIYKKMKVSFNQIDRTLLKEIMVFSSFIFLNILTDQINWNVDKLIIGRIIGTSSVAIYSVASLINTYYLQFSTAISSVFTPRINKLVNSGASNNELSFLFTRIGRLQLILLFLITSGFLFFGKPFILWWVGSSYENSYYITLILIISVTIPLIQNTGIEISRAKNLHKFRSIIYMLIALLNIVITIPLVYKWGEIGASIGTALSFIVGNVVIMNIYYQKKVRIDIISFWREIIKFIPSFILTMIAGFLFVNLFDIYRFNYFIIGVVFYSVFYLFSMWVWGFNKYEKDLLKTFSRFFLKRRKSQ